MAILSIQTGKDLCDALGLGDRNITRITLDWKVGCIAKARITEYIIEDSAKKVAQVTKRYQLQEIKLDEPAAARIDIKGPPDKIDITGNN